MLRWMGARTKEEQAVAAGAANASGVTDDPLAAIDPRRSNQKIYSVSRSVYLPRVPLRNGNGIGGGVGSLDDNFRIGINPMFFDTVREASSQRPTRRTRLTSQNLSSTQSSRGNSSGYGGSHGDQALYTDTAKLNDVAALVDRNPHYVKSIKVAPSRLRNNKSTHSSGSSGTLTTIPEGRIDFTIPRPIWPNRHHRTKSSDARIKSDYDSLVDEAVLLYTSLNHKPESVKTTVSDLSVKEVLVELLNGINATIEGKGVLSPEEMLKRVNEKIARSLDALKNVTEEEMRLLCVNLSNSKQVNSVIRAFSNSSFSGNSSQSSPEWSGRIRTISTDTEDIYQIPSGSSSSGFSEVKNTDGALQMFVHEDLASVPNGIRNAMIYGTLCRSNFKSGCDKLPAKEAKAEKQTQKKSLLRADANDKPSVWEQYYGVNMAEEMKGDDREYVPKPTDVPVYPGGRPEADFTLDVPRSELLSKRMAEDKKWRCRCRLLTTFLGLVFFLLSVMAVSLILTRGKRMFGSMV